MATNDGMRLTPAGAANLAYELQKEALALEGAAAEKRAEAQRVLEMATSEAADAWSDEGASKA